MRSRALGLAARAHAVKLAAGPRVQSFRPWRRPVLIGCDVVHLPRVRAMVAAGQATKLRHWMQRTLHPHELQSMDALLAKWHGLEPERRREALATHLAGRWALKEAAIKAHRSRALFLSDVCVHSPQRADETGRGSKPQVMIAPSPRLVAFDADVAAARGLLSCADPHRQLAPDSPPGMSVRARFAAARLRIPDLQHFQPADGSLSHDGEYVFAVVQAEDRPVRDKLSKPSSRIDSQRINGDAPHGELVAEELPTLHDPPPPSSPSYDPLDSILPKPDLRPSGFVGSSPKALKTLLSDSDISFTVDDGDGGPIHYPLPGDRGGPLVLSSGDLLQRFLDDT